MKLVFMYMQQGLNSACFLKNAIQFYLFAYLWLLNYCSYNREISRMNNWVYDLLTGLPNYDNLPVAKTCRS